MTWFERAACRGHGAHVDFVPSSDDSRMARHIANAKRLCATCPVAAPCLDYALSLEPEAHGVWGGTTQRERAAMRRAAGAYNRRTAETDAVRDALRAAPSWVPLATLAAVAEQALTPDRVVALLRWIGEYDPAPAPAATTRAARLATRNALLGMTRTGVAEVRGPRNEREARWIGLDNERTP